MEFLRNWAQRLRHADWFNTQPRVVPMSIMEHSFMVAVVVIMLMKDWPPEDRILALEAALLHDMEEGFTGDVNALAKKFDGNFKTLLGSVKANVAREVVFKDFPFLLDTWARGTQSPFVKSADLLSMWLYAKEEVDMGNNSMRSVCYIVESWLAEMAEEFSWLVSYLECVSEENDNLEINLYDVPQELRFAVGSKLNYKE